jgi:hypothetical protein
MKKIFFKEKMWKGKKKKKKKGKKKKKEEHLKKKLGYEMSNY